VALGVAVAAQAPQVLQHVAPATLARENVIDLGGERPALDAEVAVTPERVEPEPSPSTGRASALRMLGARLDVRARRDSANGQCSRRHRSTVAVTCWHPGEDANSDADEDPRAAKAAYMQRRVRRLRCRRVGGHVSALGVLDPTSLAVKNSADFFSRTL
jgi:hypothetical protein